MERALDEALIALGMPVPDSALARQARELIADIGIAGTVLAYPRLTFKRDFAAAFADQALRKPASRAAAMVAEGMLDAIAQAPFDS
jgi:hypothetical protein